MSDFYLPPGLWEEGLKEAAACLDAAVRCALTRRYREERDVWRALEDARARLRASGGASAYCYQVVRLAHSVEDKELDPLLGFLQPWDDVLPYAVRAAEGPGDSWAAELEECIDLAAKEGAFREYFQPGPEVEGWVGRMADRVGALLRDSVACARAGAGERFLPPLLVTAAALRDLLAGLTPYFRRLPGESQDELSLVAGAIGEVRRAVLWTVARDAFADGGCFQGGKELFLEECEAFLRHPLKEYAFPARSAFDGVRAQFRRLVADQEAVAEIAAALEACELLPALEAELAGCPFLDGEGNVGGGAQEALPFGLAVLVRPYGPCPQRALYYAADGASRNVLVAHSCQGLGEGPDVELGPTCGTPCDLTFRGALGCWVGAGGKVHCGAIDRLAPPPRAAWYGGVVSAVCRAERPCHHALVLQWEEHPDLFARLDALGPFVLIQQPPETLLVCRSEAGREVEAALGRPTLGADQARAALERVRVGAEGTWLGFVLGREPEGLISPLAGGGDPRKGWRAVIRHRVGRVPDFPWLAKQLRPFGVRETTSGPGSHGALVRCRDGVERKLTTWYALRTARPVPFAFLWSCVERLGIPYEEFAESVSGGEALGRQRQEEHAGPQAPA
jgi:hypothetical protein